MIDTTITGQLLLPSWKAPDKPGQNAFCGQRGSSKDKDETRRELIFG